MGELTSANSDMERLRSDISALQQLMSSTEAQLQQVGGATPAATGPLGTPPSAPLVHPDLPCPAPLHLPVQWRPDHYTAAGKPHSGHVNQIQGPSPSPSPSNPHLHPLPFLQEREEKAALASASEPLRADLDTVKQHLAATVRELTSERVFQDQLFTASEALHTEFGTLKAQMIAAAAEVRGQAAGLWRCPRCQRSTRAAGEPAQHGRWLDLQRWACSWCALAHPAAGSGP
jgi:hypothetical protein